MVSCGLAVISCGGRDSELSASEPPTGVVVPDSTAGNGVEVSATAATAPAGFSPARIRIDPRWVPNPGAVSIPVLSTEVECAGGFPPDGRAVTLSVIENSATVYVSVDVETVTDGATCPTNPTEPLSVPLGEPLGSRRVVDGSSGAVLLDGDGNATDGQAQPATLSLTMTGPTIYAEGSVTVLEITDSAGALVAPRRFATQGRPVQGSGPDPVLRTQIDNVQVPPGTVHVDAWQLICDITAPCTGPDDSLNELIDIGRPERGPTCTTTVTLEPAETVDIAAIWTLEGCTSIS
jgi:hypothetical protein